MPLCLEAALDLAILYKCFFLETAGSRAAAINRFHPSTKESIPRIHASQTFLSLTNFIEKSNNIYDIKCASMKIYFMMNLMILI